MDKRDQILARLAVGLGLINQGAARKAAALVTQFPGRSFDRILLDTGFIDEAGHQSLVRAFNVQLQRARTARSEQLRSRGLSGSDLLLDPHAPASGRSTRKVRIPHAEEPTLEAPPDDGIYEQRTVVLSDDDDDGPLPLNVPDDDDDLLGPDDEDEDEALTLRGAGGEEVPLILKVDESDDGLDVFDEATSVLRDDEGDVYAQSTTVLADEGDVYAQSTTVLADDGGDVYAQNTTVLSDDEDAIYAQNTTVLADDEDAIYAEPTLALADEDEDGEIEPQELRLVDDSSAELAALPKDALDESSLELASLDVRLKRDVEVKQTGPSLVPGAKPKEGSGPLSSKEFQRRLKMRLGFAGFTIGDYKIRGEISRGAFGVVLEAEPGGVTKTMAKDRGYEGNLALKVSLENKADPRATERFLEETRVQIAFDHPHIVRIFDCGVERGLTYYSMELIKGLEARSHVLKSGPMPPLLAVRIVKEVASALTYVHQRRTYHRDLKPHNILLDKASKPYRAVLIDFGLVTEHEKGDQDKGLILGTPSYMPPEQAQPRGGHGEINSTSDIYALGATFYFLLTGRAPFTDKDPRKIIKMVVSQAPRDPTELNPQIPRRIADICLKCIEKGQRDRYHSAKQLQAELERELKSGQMMLKAKSFLGKFLGKRK